MWRNKAGSAQYSFGGYCNPFCGAGFAEATAEEIWQEPGAGIVLCEGRQELCCLPGSPLHIGCAKRLPWSTHEAAVSAV